MTTSDTALPVTEATATATTTETTTATTPAIETAADNDVTLADDDSEIEIGTDDDDSDDGEEGEPKPGEKPRLTRNQRRTQRIRDLEAENAELRRSRSPAASINLPEDDSDLVKPKEDDFPNDYLAFDRAMRNYETRLAVRAENRQVAKASKESTDAAQKAEEHRLRLGAYNGRLAEVKSRITDFDTVMGAAAKVDIRDDIRDQVLESPKGPLLAYYLAKNPDVLADLHKMPPIAAAKKLGVLEARIRGPKPKTATKAAAPVVTPKGGTAGPTKSLAQMSQDEYFATRQRELEG